MEQESSLLIVLALILFVVDCTYTGSTKSAPSSSQTPEYEYKYWIGMQTDVWISASYFFSYI